MDNDLDLGRYAAGLRRHTFAILAVGVVGLLGGLFFATSSDHTSTIQMQALPRYLDLASVGLDPSQFDLDRIVDVLVAEVNQDEFEREVASHVGADVEISATRDLERPSIVIVVQSPTADDVTEAQEFIANALQDRYAVEFGIDVARVRTGTETRQATTEQQVAEIDAQLQAATEGQATLVEGLIAERQRLVDRGELNEAVLTALDRFETDVRSDLRKATIQEAEKRSALLLGIVGLVAGLALGATVSLIVTAFDRTIRTRRDLAKLGLSDLVGVIPIPPDAVSLASTRQAVAALASSVGAPDVQITALTDKSDLAWMSQIERPDTHTPAVAIRPPVAVSSEAVENAATCAISILAVEWGKDSKYRVVRAANELSAAGAGHVGVLLYGVAPREISGVER